MTDILTSRSRHSNSPSGVIVLPISGHTGAEISGVDISEPLDEETVATISNALDTWKVVFFRNQNLDHASQIAFGHQFGNLTYAHPTTTLLPTGIPRSTPSTTAGWGSDSASMSRRSGSMRAP
jgi:alpha-ketoglutarate-dependent taurine dioxygenase